MEHREEYKEPTQDKIPNMDKNLRAYLRKEIRSYTNINPDEIIEKIEEISRESVANPRAVLASVFEGVFGEKIMLFVNRLLGYQKRPCRNGAACHRLGCYYKHPPKDWDENMMVVEERPSFSRREQGGPEERFGGGSRILLEKQKRLIEMLSKRVDLPPDVISLIDQLKKITQRIRPGCFASGGAPEEHSDSTRFLLTNRKEWMTRDHLSTYPGVMHVTDDGIMEFRNRGEAEEVFNLISRVDSNSNPKWI
ncbi:hypothetical protein NEFER03_1281 [Nematocida sp. LUAm3]|nr:hypothetical protein NEFER03_1281 [Nematocida sp. LUAm3]KAI5174097.1 hypothetical protein NEFER02_0564 [Nematocida sp. LUAm2]KAI5177160.1 hypothetical protein NEFER01_0435 [Nematocida sp. LUAm1]